MLGWGELLGGGRGIGRSPFEASVLPPLSLGKSLGVQPCALVGSALELPAAVLRADLLMAGLGWQRPVM